MDRRLSTGTGVAPLLLSARLARGARWAFGVGGAGLALGACVRLLVLGACGRLLVLGACGAMLVLGACGASAPEPEQDAVAQADAFIAEQPVDKTRPDWKLGLTKPPKFGFGAGRTYHWVLETNKGTLRVRLLPEVAPMHVSSTIYLTRLGFYDGIVFHRVIPGFMAQGGDPLGTGTGGPGYKYAGEFDRHARHNKPGILSMANAGPGTDGSQFFLTFGPTPHLDDKHTVFGELTDGHEALQSIEALGSPSGATRERVLIEKATIEVR